MLVTGRLLLQRAEVPHRLHGTALLSHRQKKPGGYMLPTFSVVRLAGTRHLIRLVKPRKAYDRLQSWAAQ